MTETLDELSKEMTTRLAEIRGRGESSDGLVTVSMDGTGKVEELHVATQAMHLSSQQLADKVTETYNNAREATRTAIAEASTSMVPAVDLQKELAEIQSTLHASLQQFMDGVEQALRRMKDAT